MTITAKFQSRCLGCGEQIQAGERIQWERGIGSSHEGCADPKSVSEMIAWVGHAPTEQIVQAEAGYHNMLDADPALANWKQVDQIRLVLVAELTRRANAQAGEDRQQVEHESFQERGGKPSACEPGVYEKNGEIFVVKPNREKTRVYAKRLVEIELSTPRVLEDGTEVNYDIEFEYAKGAIYDLAESDRMDTARAEQLAIRYGRCINCGRSLKTAESVKRGIGPVCMKRFKQAA